MINSFRKKCKENGVSPVIGVILVVAIVIILAALISVVFLGFSDNLSTVGTTPAAVSLDDGELQITNLGASEKILIKRNDSTIEIDSVGETQNLMGGEEIVAVNDDGSETVIDTITRQEVIESGGTAGTTAEVSIKNGSLQIDNIGTAEKILVKREDSTIELTGENETQDLFGGEEIIAEDENGDKTTIKTITEQEVIESGGTKYKNPNTLDKNDVELVSDTSSYSSGEDRLVGTTEIYKVNFTDKYDPYDFDYTWGIGNCYIACDNAWHASRTYPEPGIAKYHYETNSGGAAPTLTISTEEFSYSYTVPRYQTDNPINSVSFTSSESYYSGGEDRLATSKENWKITQVSLHPKVDDYLGDNTPSKLSDYNYKNWRRANCYIACDNVWDSTITKDSGYTATFSYDNNGGLASPTVDVKVPGIERTQTFSPERYQVKNPIQNVEFYSNRSGTYRNVSEVEYWEISNIDTHPKTSTVFSSKDPSELSEYSYSSWGIGNCYIACDNAWSATIDDNRYNATYTYDSSGGKASPTISIKYPGSEFRKYTPSNYKVYSK